MIHLCSPYKFADILIIVILKVVEKCKIYQNKECQKSPGVGNWTKKFTRVAIICQILKICPRVNLGGGGVVKLVID